MIMPANIFSNHTYYIVITTHVITVYDDTLELGGIKNHRTFKEMGDNEISCFRYKLFIIIFSSW